MARKLLLAAAAAFLLFSVSVFADTSSYGTMQSTMAPAMTFDQLQSSAAVNAWVGKSSEQLQMAIGLPSYESVAANGDSVYDYVEHGTGYYTNGDPGTVRLSFEVDGNGNILHATTSSGL